MNIKIQGTRIELTPDIKEYVEKKLEAVHKLVDQRDESVLYEVEVGKMTEHHEKGDVYKAEVHLRKKGGNLYATAHAEDVFAAIDKIKDEISHALSSDKEKKETLLRKGQMKIKSLLKRLSW
ncbi:MAG: ribosomal subunit interface protein [Candidatus Zambryskibacteria bacterium CG10_big_fil_rev_8_21_14_0_10_42_12]|uniref:Ribosomal subunit interface protein n=1 Tax=Candidatus Zambryskibacteria bacterium CG10_big_fil_rev_8_21_14_0_10_42_12 TaxID=1975115 RepID=A0A2H0QUI9_9BACT|nr:MAG: ribosomal subunit interface protein [Candidatus Zambryskibacteria bacterium CG10_big_fil_rev_8_21_14_0_10_42_12]